QGSSSIRCSCATFLEKESRPGRSLLRQAPVPATEETVRNRERGAATPPRWHERRRRPRSPPPVGLSEFSAAGCFVHGRGAKQLPGRCATGTPCPAQAEGGRQVTTLPLPGRGKDARRPGRHPGKGAQGANTPLFRGSTALDRGGPAGRF